jgi:hypothetical protein
MKINILNLSLFTLCAAAVLVVPASSRAQAMTNAPATATETAPAKKHHNGTPPFHGKLEAVDTNAMTLTVGKRTFSVTSATTITKDGKPAMLADGVTGESVSGTYKKTADGKMDALTVHFGDKTGGKHKKGSGGTSSN